MNIFLIGLPGSGKTTLGKELAKRLNYSFVDTDKEITESENSSIENIFKSLGESYFRTLEQKILKKIMQEDKQIVSTGGGLPCFFDNMETMNSKGITIFLDVPIENLQKRINAPNRNSRPMFENKSDKEILFFLTEKEKERLPYYSKASFRLKGSNLKISDIENLLKKEGLIV